MCKIWLSDQPIDFISSYFFLCSSTQLSSIQPLSSARLFVSTWTAAHQASLSITNSQSILKLMFIELSSLIFLKRSLVFPILVFSSISLHWSLRKGLSYLSLLFCELRLQIGISFLFTSLLFTAICKASSESHFAFLNFFFLGMVLIPVSCTMSWTSAQSSSCTLSDLIIWIYLKLPLYNCKGFDLGHTWMVKWFSLLSSL